MTLRLPLFALLFVQLAGCQFTAGDDDAADDEELSQWEALQASVCDLTPVVPFSNFEIGGLDESQRLRPTSERAELNLTGEKSSACVSGDLYILEVNANLIDVAIEGDAAFVDIDGDAGIVYILGDVSSIDIEGDNNRVYARSVSVINDYGRGNEILDIRTLNFSF